MPFQVAGEQTIYTIVSVDAPTQLTLDRAYEGISAGEKLYAIRFPLFVDYRVPTNWEERYYVVGFNEHVTLTTDDQGRPLRLYEVLLPASGDAYRQGVPLSPTLSEPIAYAGIGVSAADNEATTQDDPKWASGRWGKRPGNEGRVGALTTIFRVLRERPPVPLLPAPLKPEHSTATAADNQGHSFDTYRWLPMAGLRTHIYRGLDETLFQVDWAQRPRPALDASQAQFFPNATTEPRWTQGLRQQVANGLNTLNNFTHDATGSAQALAYYRELSNDGLRILAGLPGNEAAFSQLTTLPLDPGDPANADRRGPDTPASYTPNPNLRAYVDTLNGLMSNRYLYRALYVDAAHNRSGLSLASPPVLVPDVVAPHTPTITKVLGGDRQITLRWNVNRESDLDKYLVFRAEDPSTLENIGGLSPIEVIPQSGVDEQEITDKPLVGNRAYYYRVAARNTFRNISPPSAIFSAYVADTAIPNPPASLTAVRSSRTRSDGTFEQGVLLTWATSVEPLEIQVQRQINGGIIWPSITAWLPQGTTQYFDNTALPGHGYRFRLRVRNVSGNFNVTYTQAEVES
jgi:hypothetical protein